MVLNLEGVQILVEILKIVFIMKGKGDIMKKALYVGKDVESKRVQIEELQRVSLMDVGKESKISLIQELAPLGILHAKELLDKEVKELAGERYQRKDRHNRYRWTRQGGSIYIVDQKVPIVYQRVRDKQGNEVKLETYEQLKKPKPVNKKVLIRVFNGLSCRRYRECCEMIPQVFGLSASAVSNQFKEASEKILRELLERRLDGYDIVAIIIDGKTFQRDEMIIALGITIEGEKVILGFIQAATENAIVCREFLWDLLERGLKIEQGVLCVIDGSKGLRRAVRDVFGSRAVVQRCQWHKRENVISYLPKKEQDYFKRALQNAYAEPGYEGAKASLEEIITELRLVNESAARSLEEGLDETLTLHRLGLFDKLGRSLKTTNCIESVMALIEDKTSKVDYWVNSNQKQRWLAVSLLDIEQRLNKICGYKYLHELRVAIMMEIEGLESRHRRGLPVSDIKQSCGKAVCVC